jgi:Co/Zn/Cd efflux system component
MNANVWTSTIDAPTMARYRTAYGRAWILSLIIVMIELTGSILSGSFALRADVWHVAGDMLVAFAPLATTYARGGHPNPDKIVLLGGLVVATLLMLIGGLLLEEARGSLASPTPAHEVHGWLLSGFALASALANLWQHRFLSQVHASHRDVAHLGFHLHVRMDLLKNLALPVLGVLLALHLVARRADSWAAACIGAWIAIRGLALFARGVLTFQRRERRFR